MKYPTNLALAVTLLLGSLHAQPVTSSLPPDAQLESYSSFTILFPEPMVAADQIEADAAESPLTVTPAIDAAFVWLSQSQGRWQVDGPRAPGIRYGFALRDGLRTLAGSPFPTGSWTADLTAPALTVAEDYGERSRLSARPQIPLEFNYPIRLADAAEHIWIQDRATRERFPVEILLNYAADELTGDVLDLTGPAPQPPTAFRVRPRDPLPVDRTYDLVVDAPADAFAGRPLPYPRVFSLGRTRPLAIDYVAARNRPKETPRIEVKFKTPLVDDLPLPPDALTIEPAVPALALRVEGEFIIAEGTFDPAIRYRVTVAPTIVDDHGYSLAAPSIWGATFPPKTGTLFFPADLLRQRAALGLRFAFLQSNTGPVTWRLAKIPLEKFQTVRRAQSTITETNAPTSLIDQFDLPITTEGSFPATTDEALRQIEWNPHQSPVTSHHPPALLEAATTDPTGARVLNSALLLFNDVVFTRKSTEDAALVRLADMGSGQPLPGIGVRLVTRDLLDIATATTDEFGIATFPAIDLVGAAFFITDTGSIELTAPGPAFPSGSISHYGPDPTYLGTIIPDRPLYRPGHEAKFKGFLRQATDLAVPTGELVTWEILAGYQDVVVATGTAPINAFGGWDTAWTIPERGKLGDFRIRATLDGLPAGDPGTFLVEEYRNPPFSVLCDPAEPAAPATATVTISSQYFHGAPNVGSTVQWTATWTSDHDGNYYYADDGFNEVDVDSEHRTQPSYSAEVTGETTLDANGQATLTTTAPFKDPGNRAHASVFWEIDVTGPDGQTISGGANQDVTLDAVTLGVRGTSDDTTRELAFDLRAIPFEKDGPLPAKIDTTLYFVRTKSVQERVAPFVYRYRNTDVFTEIDRRQAAPGDRLTFTPGEPGAYVLVARPLPGEPGIPVSASVLLTGPGEAELPVTSDQTLSVALADPDAPFTIGDQATFTVRSPSPGIAWVTVETDHVLDSFTIPLDGNASTINLPIKPSYAPNATLAVYLLRPGKTDALPGEMFGTTTFTASDPGKILDLALTTDAPTYQPREAISGTVHVTSGGIPVANAELTLAAVDDSVLTLGNWTLPDLLPTFYPTRSYGVVTYQGLDGYVTTVTEKSLTQKGYTVGGGGKAEFGNTDFIRKNFQPRILWLPSVTTDAEGNATFETEAPDNLTRFRVVALAQTKANQFGSGDTTFEITKDLLIEPALPRFLRAGDQIDLRATVRQKAMDTSEVTLTAQAEGLELETNTTTLATERDVPATTTFRATTPTIHDSPVTSHESPTASVTFTAQTTTTDLRDSTSITLPILPATITVRESIAGPWTGPTFQPATQAPPTWKAGTANLTLSTSEYLTQLLGVPQILEYPHGCFEQKSARLLVITHCRKLLAYLPASSTANYDDTIRRTLDEMSASLLPDDTLPYWPFGTEGNAYVTIQSAWTVAEAINAGLEVPENLAFGLPRALDAMIARTSRLTAEPNLRAFALFARAQFADHPDLTASAQELILQRDRLANEARAILAITCHQLDILPDQQRTLVAELAKSPSAAAFNPRTFASATRDETITTWARQLIDSAGPSEPLTDLLTNSASLSTQENLWLLVAFNALLEAKPTTDLATKASPTPTARSRNDSAATWSDLDLATLADFTVTNLTPNSSQLSTNNSQPTNGTFVLTAARPLGPDENQPVSAGLRIERVVKNLTDPTRLGTPESPHHLADELLITYRLFSDEAQSYVALEDALPAGVEVLNPNLSMFGRTYDLPTDGDTATLSYSELRDAQTNLYFDALPAGASNTAVLARATAAGTFTWPATQIAPMYDARHHARTAPSTVVIE